jgi:hypothetical protein
MHKMIMTPDDKGKTWLTYSLIFIFLHWYSWLILVCSVLWKVLPYFQCFAEHWEYLIFEGLVEFYQTIWTSCFFQNKFLNSFVDFFSWKMAHCRFLSLVLATCGNLYLPRTLFYLQRNLKNSLVIKKALLFKWLISLSAVYFVL